MTTKKKSPSRKVNARFEIKTWDEKPIDDEAAERKVTRATVTKEYSGDITGTSLTEWVMAYTPDGSAIFVGLERIRGAIEGHTGSLVLQHVGTFADEAAKAAISVVAKSGTGDLANAEGQGNFVADPAGSIELDIAFD